MKRTVQTFICLFFVAACLFIPWSSAMSADVPRMTKEDLKGMLEKDTVILVDIRSGKDWKSSEFKIQSAVREESDKVESWAKKYAKDKTIVLYCA
jgi:hypothetical protein